MIKLLPPLVLLILSSHGFGADGVPDASPAQSPTLEASPQPASSPAPAASAAPTAAPEASAAPTPSDAQPLPQDIQPPPPEILDQPTASPADSPQQTQPHEDSNTPVSESDSKREARFSRIYSQYNQHDIGDERWSEIAGDKVSERYTLQNGDTLWDISSKLFGNGFYWPKVWELNDDITNPHYVKIGRVLKFSPGSATTAPTLDVEDPNINITNATSSSDEVADDTDPGLDYDTVITGDAEGSQVPIPPGKKSRPVLSQIPPSFKEANRNSGRYDSKTGFAKDGLVRPLYKITKGPIPSIVVEREWQRDGKVIEMEGDTTVASTYQNIIIRLSGPANAGDFFTVFSSNGKVTDPTTGYSIGLELETRAEIQIEEAVQGSENTYRAMVVYTALPVRLNDSVRSGRLISRADSEVNGAESNVAARIVNGEDNKRFIFGLHAVVFIDKGSEDGLQVGSLLPVLKNISVRNENTLLKFDSRPIGEIKVVQVEPHVATAIIVVEKDAIMPGDMTAIASDEPAVDPKALDEAEPLGADVSADEE